jgi:hypothetical protein
MNTIKCHILNLTFIIQCFKINIIVYGGDILSLQCPVLNLILLQVSFNIFWSWKTGISSISLRIKIRSSNFWDIAECQWVACYLNFEIFYILDSWKLGPICYDKTSVMNYPLMLDNVTENKKPQLHNWKSTKSCKNKSNELHMKFWSNTPVYIHISL